MVNLGEEEESSAQTIGREQLASLPNARLTIHWEGRFYNEGWEDCFLSRGGTEEKYHTFEADLRGKQGIWKGLGRPDTPQGKTRGTLFRPIC